MMNGKWGVVVDVLEDHENMEILMVQVGDIKVKAIHYCDYYDRDQACCTIGNRVYVNTVALDLKLGSGGYGFVIAKGESRASSGGHVHFPCYPGHIIKLRYTPVQRPVLAAEAPESSVHDRFQQPFSLHKKRVFVAELHSVLPLWASMLYLQDSKRKLVYIMDDQACLHAAFSHHIRTLKKRTDLTTITFGQATGGDIETINLYTALEAAIKVVEADEILITQGPGVVGTGTERGFSGMVLSDWIHAIHTLEGEAVVIPRLHLADQRHRHLGFSHHTLTPLLYHTLVTAHIPYPDISELDQLPDLAEHVQQEFVEGYLQQVSTLGQKHHLIPIPVVSAHRMVNEALEWYPGSIQSMRKGYEQEPLQFQGVGAAVFWHVNTS